MSPHPALMIPFRLPSIAPGFLVMSLFTGVIGEVLDVMVPHTGPVRILVAWEFGRVEELAVNPLSLANLGPVIV